MTPIRAVRTCSCVLGRPGRSNRSSRLRMVNQLTSLAAQSPSLGTTPLLELTGTTITAPSVAVRTCSCVLARPGRSNRSSRPQTGRQTITLASPFPTLETTPSLELIQTTTTAPTVAVRTCSCVLARPGRSNRSSRPPTGRQMTSSATQSPSLETTPLLELMQTTSIRAVRTCSCVLARPGCSNRS